MRSTTLLAFVLARLALASEPEAEFCAPTVVYHYCVLDDCLEALSNQTQAAPVFCNEYLENDSIDVPSFVPATAGPADISSACNCVLLATTEFPTPISSSGLLSGPPTILSPQTSTVPVPSDPAKIETETPTQTLAPIYTTSTVYKVLTYTSEGQIYTDTVLDYTTICPITESSQMPVTPSTSYSAATTTEPASDCSARSHFSYTHSKPYQNSTFTSSTLSLSTLSISSSSVAPSTSVSTTSFSSSSSRTFSNSTTTSSRTFSNSTTTSSSTFSTSTTTSSSTSSTSTTTSSSTSSTTTSSSTTSSAAASSTTSCTLPAETQLVVNPGFDIETDGSFSFPWSLNSMAAVSDSSTGFTPIDGNEFVFLQGAVESDATVSQTISGFVPASPYTLSFFLAASGMFQTEGGTCSLSVTLAGVQVFFMSINNNIFLNFPGQMFFPQEVTITPTGSTQTLEFDFNCGDVQQSPDLALDDITITGPDACPAFCSIDPAAEAFASAGAEATLYCNDFLGIPQPSTVTIQAAATSTTFSTTTVSPTPTPTSTVSQSMFALKDKRSGVPDTLTNEFLFTSTYNLAQQSAACSCLSIQPALASTTSTTTIDITSTVVVTPAPTTSSTTPTLRTTTV